MDVKRELPEDVYGLVPQRLHDMVKAGLPESQSPAVEPHTHRYHVYNPMPSVGLESSFFQATLWPVGDAQ